MRILHTADWHLGDRLGRIDRTDDLRRAVERVARLCQEHAVDVLLIAGDLFSEMARPDSLRASIEHLQTTFHDFLLSGGTILALTGNHDNETFCQTLRLVMTLAAPAPSRPGELRPAGRLYLATNPTFLRLADRHTGQQVQFLLMPYPTPPRYLRDDEQQRYGSVEEKNRHLQAAYAQKLAEFQQDARYDKALQTVLSAHVHVRGVSAANLFRMTETESILFEASDLPAQMAYVALGHIHQPQTLFGLPHVRYSGSIERLDLGERNDQKGVVLVDIGPDGRQGAPVFLPLDATPVYDVTLHTPLADHIAGLREQHPDAHNDLVRLHFTYTAGVDNLEESLRQLEEIFPRWYYRDWVEAGSLNGSLVGGDGDRPQGFEETVRGYLKQELANHPDEDRDAVLALAEKLLHEVQA
ncbi:MAG TPA: exonuclease subunit SbcD [Gemmataceae bacterium]|nr:exonuclease subunit SbcD [Gemmataceae bacterium]